MSVLALARERVAELSRQMDAISTAMKVAGAEIICDRFTDIGPYSARHMAAEIYSSMRQVSEREVPPPEERD